VAPSAEPSAEQGCADAVAAAVQTRYEGVEDLVARFRQETRSVAFGGAAEPQAARGQVWFAKPGRMRWEYREPEPSVVVSDGSTLWIFDPTAREAQRLPVDRAFLSGAAIQFLLGEGDLRETFQIRPLACGGAVARLELRPRQESTYERLELSVESATGWITETRVHDLFGNETRVVFEDLTANQGIPDAHFDFEPPEDVRVLELPAPGPQ
jgi:outer membrane lipoprotein carrier protein